MRIILKLLIICAFISLKSWAQEVVHEHSIHHSFIENKGQWNDNILFKSRFLGGNLWVQQHKLMFHIQDYSAMKENHAHPSDKPIVDKLYQTALHLNFVGSNEVTQIEKSGATKAYYNYLIGNNQQNWTSEVRGYSEAVLKNIYENIDLKLIEEAQELKYEFHVAPNTNPNAIQLNYAGHKSLKVNKRGQLVIKTELGEIIEDQPYAYQIVNGSIREVSCSYKLSGDNVTFELGEYVPYATLVIDPVLIFATYSGSITDNFGMTATYGHDGSAYSGGTIYGNSYPTPDNAAYDVNSNFTLPDNPYYGITDVFISKYASDGTTMLWTTFLGGGNDTIGTETIHSMICDVNDNIYVYGATSSIDFPMQGGYQTTHAGGTLNSNFYYNGVYYHTGTDIYVAKISANGHDLLASTYMGGSQNDGINFKVTSGNYGSVAAYDSLTKNYGDQFRGEIMIDSVGNCIVASCSRSTDFPTQSAFQPNNAGQQDGVVFKLTSNLSSLVWSSYYGGTNNDACYSVKVDSLHNFIVGGGTSSNDLFTTAGSWQPNYNGGKTDGFIFKIDPSGTTVTNATYVGTNNYDQVFFVEIDRNNNIFVVGQSEGGNFPVLNASYVNFGSSQFIAKFDPDLTSPLQSTVFGNGSSTINISPSAFLVDICGNIYVSGWGANILQSTPLSGMPITANAFQSSPPNGFDFYLIVIEKSMNSLLYGTYIGGYGAEEHVDGGTSRFDKNGVVYQSVCAGCRTYDSGTGTVHNWSDFPTTPGAWSSQNLSDNCNNLIFKFDFELIPNAEFTIDDNLGCAAFEVTFDNFSTESDSYLWDFGNGDTSTVIFNPTIVYDTPGVYDVYLYVTDSICLLTDTASIQITVTDSIELTTSPDEEFCIPIDLDITAYTNGAADYFIWSTSPNYTDTINSNLSDSTIQVMPIEATTYYVQAGNDGCYLEDSVVINFIGTSISLSANDSICLGETTTITAIETNPSFSFTYEWNPDSVIVNPSVTNSVTVQPSESQYIYMTATTALGCEVNDSIFIHVGYIPDNVVNASALNHAVPIGGSTTLIGSPSGYNYSWTPTTGLSNPLAQSTDVTVDETTIYTLTVWDEGCYKSDTTIVTVYEFICGEPYVFVPNAFSPNGDYNNDVLYVMGPPIQEMVFRIYDRWGELVFESFSRGDGWDGTFRGKALDPDVYDYYLKVICIDNEESIMKGNITLIR